MMGELAFGGLQSLFVKLTHSVMVEGTPSVLNLRLNHEDRAVNDTEKHTYEPFCWRKPILISGINQALDVLRGAEAGSVAL